MLPGDPRAITEAHLETVRALGVTGGCFHSPGPLLFDLTTADCRRVRGLYEAAGLDLPQFGIGYSECLFDPDAGVRQRVVRTIGRGIEAARELNAGVALIRTGSLSPSGSYSPSPRNYEPGRFEQLIETLRRIADKAEQEGVTVVIETHLLTIMGSPEINRRVIDAVGSDRLRLVMDFVNHFQSLEQVYHSTDRINHIYDVMGSLSAAGHVKDIKISDGLVLHIDEEVPGEGLLDLATALRRWEQGHPDGYMLVEHLPEAKIPAAVANVRRIAEEAGIAIY
jgi:sugar phosphate isomerase/epimerase